MINIIFIAIIVLAAAAVIAIAEIVDGRSSRRQRRIMEEGIKAVGTVTSVTHRGIIDARSAYAWKVTVAYEHEGESFSLEQGSTRKPALREGDHVCVYVCRIDPWKSCFAGTA